MNGTIKTAPVFLIGVAILNGCSGSRFASERYVKVTFTINAGRIKMESNIAK